MKYFNTWTLIGIGLAVYFSYEVLLMGHPIFACVILAVVGLLNAPTKRCPKCRHWMNTFYMEDCGAIHECHYCGYKEW